MRRLYVTLLIALVAVPAAAASTRATGDGVLELKAVYGTVAVGQWGQPAKGALWGQMDRGSLLVYDPVVGDGQVYVSGGPDMTKTPVDLQGNGPDATRYTGRNIHFRVTGGTYKLTLVGDSIDLTAVGVGTARLAGDPAATDDGYFALNSGKWSPVPVFLLPKQFKQVQFGDTTP
jgi:hypothetical protein